MAARNNKKSSGSKVMVIFWLSFAVVITGIFFLNSATIKKNFNLFVTRLTAPSGAIMNDDLFNLDDEIVTIEEPSEYQTPSIVAPEHEIRAEPEVTQTPSQPEQPRPSAQTQTTNVQPPVPQPVPPPVVQTRDRTIYFTQVNNDGQILQSRVTRKIPVSQSPMQDALNLLLTGPSAEEINRGIINLIPQNTRVLSALVRGSTAYISFSEDFLFNTFGVEGYVAQLRQIVWTVTEFSNVSDVQILIEGRRMDYLGEGIWIGSPISRQSF